MPVRRVMKKLRTRSVTDEQNVLSPKQLRELTHGKPVLWEQKYAPMKSIVQGSFYNPKDRKQSLQLQGGMTSLSRYARIQPEAHFTGKQSPMQIEGVYLPKFVKSTPYRSSLQKSSK